MSENGLAYPRELRYTPQEIVDEIQSDSLLTNALGLLVRTEPTSGRKLGVVRWTCERYEEVYLDVEEDDMIKAQVSHWIGEGDIENWRISDSSSCPNPTSKRGIPPRDRIAVRTVRMLLFFESLMANTASKSGLQNLVAYLRENCQELDELVHAIKKQYIVIPCGENPHQPSSRVTNAEPREHKWQIWLPLVIATAIAKSQCEYFRALCWEAYSAGRARADLAQALPEQFHPVIDFIAILIRYQSAVGQLARGTGGRGFLKIVHRVANQYGFSPDAVKKALQIVAVTELLRNRRLPDFGAQKSIAGLNVNLDVSQTADRNEILANIHKIFETDLDSLESENLGATWSWSRRLEVPEPTIGRFKSFVESNYVALAEESDVEFPTDVGIHKAEWFCFHLEQVEDLKEVLEEQVKALFDAADQKAAFHGSFRLRFNVVPSCFDSGHAELAVVVLLNDRIAAEHLLFKSQPIGNPEFSDDRTAGTLLAHLFALAKAQFRLDLLALRRDPACPSPGQTNYIPFPLLKRMLRIVYRLRPGMCVSVPIVFDQGTAEVETEMVRIPLGLRENTEIVEAVAKYVLAVVLNRAMSQGFRSCDIDLAGLAAHEEEGEAWVDRIRGAAEANAFGILADRYLRDYNTERKCFEFVDGSDPVILKPVGIGDLGQVLSTYLTRNGPPSKCLVLGIDVGGTFTKYSFYQFDPEDGKWIQVGERFRTLTAIRAGKRALAPLELVAQMAERMVDAVATEARRNPQVGEALKEHGEVLAAGISWPGPVRHNHIAGTSGTITQFGLSRDIMDNKIEDIMSLDLAKAFYECWRNSHFPVTKCNQRPPYVALVNDGSADGVGMLAALRPSAEYARCRLAVIKLGTGTAGAVFENGRIKRGLCEWGKLLLDLGAPPNKSYPEGVANLHLSKKTMPAFARLQDSNFFQQDDLDSQELGLLLEARESKYSKNSLKELRKASGILHTASRFDNVDSEMLRRALQDGGHTEWELFDVLSPYLLAVGKAGQRKLLRMVINGGIFRLRKILGEDDGILLDVFNEYNERQAATLLERPCNIAMESAKALGCYLGDLLVLLNDEYDMDLAILGGGVLTGVTGETARREASERVKLYGLDAQRLGPCIGLGSERKPGSWPATGGSSAELDTGTHGAAAYATAEFLFQLKQRGITEIEAKLMKLGPDETIEVNSGLIRLPGDHLVTLREFALTDDEVNSYLQKCGPRLGFLKSPSADPNRSLYTRWVVTMGD